MKGHGPDIGDIVAGRFRIVSRLSRGVWTSVFKAYQRDLDRFVCVKVMHAELADDPRMVERFRREALFASQLTHPNTITTYDYGRTEGNSFYIAMELIDGHDLLAELRKNGALGPERALGVMIQICRSLSEVHDLGMVHRDLKPDNIILTAPRVDRDTEDFSDFVKVLDFGIAKATRAIDGVDGGLTKLTQTGRVVGTPLYMAPEQLLEEPVMPSCDVYALGHILFEIITGFAAYDGPGQSSMETMMRHLEDTVPDLPQPHTHHPLQTIIRRATEKDPAHRYQSAREMLEALDKVRLHTAPDMSESVSRPIHLGSPSPPTPSKPSALSSRLLSRRHELDWVSGHLDEVRNNQHSRIVLLHGSAGVGKSMILDTFLESLLENKDELTFTLCRHRHHKRDIREGGLWADVCILLGLEDAGDGSLSIHLRDALRNYSTIQESQIPTLLRLLRRDPELHSSLKELKDKRLQLFEALAKPFLGLARRQLFVWAIEDLQEEDPLTLAFLDYLQTRFEDSSCRLMVLGTVSKDDIIHGSGGARMLRPLMSASPPEVFKLEIRGVSARGAREVLEDVLDAPPGQDLSESIRKLTKGHPQFMIEVLTRLFEQDGLELTNGAYQLRASAASNLVAPHLAGVIRDRIHTLAEQDERGRLVVSLLEVVALLGNDVERDWCEQYISSLSSAAERSLLSKLDASISYAIELDLLHERYGALRFTVPIAREVLLKDVIDLGRRKSHFGEMARNKLLAAARLLFKKLPEPTGIELKQIVRRFMAGGDRKSAIGCLRQAADLAYRTFNIETALDNYLKAYRLARESGDPALTRDPEAMIVLLRLGEIHGTLLDLALAEDYLSKAKEVAAVKPLTSLKTKVLGRVLQLEGELARQRGDFSLAAERLGQARRIFEAVSDENGVARVIIELARVKMLEGDTHAALEGLLEASVMAEMTGSTLVQARAAVYLSRLRRQRGELEASCDDATRALRLCETEDNLVTRADALLEQGTSRFILGGHYDARTTLTEAIRVLLKVRDRAALGSAYRLQAATMAAIGEYDEAIKYLEFDLALAQESQDTAGIGVATIMLTDVMTARAHTAEQRVTVELLGEEREMLQAVSAYMDNQVQPQMVSRAETRIAWLLLGCEAKQGFAYLDTILSAHIDEESLMNLEARAVQATAHALAGNDAGAVDALRRINQKALASNLTELRLLTHMLAVELLMVDGSWAEAAENINYGYGLALAGRYPLEAAVFRHQHSLLHELRTGHRSEAWDGVVISSTLSLPVRIR